MFSIFVFVVGSVGFIFCIWAIVMVIESVVDELTYSRRRRKFDDDYSKLLNEWDVNDGPPPPPPNIKMEPWTFINKIKGKV